MKLSSLWGVMPSVILGCSLIAPASANSALQGYYYKMPQNHIDANQGIDGVLTGLVESSLGPNGLPVVSTFGKTHSGGSGPIKDFDATTSELLWWSTASPYGVLFEKTQTDSLPLNESSFYPDGQNSDSPYFRTARWNGSFNLASPGSVTFSLGSDDDAFVFVDGQLKVDDGGVHAMSFVPNVVTGLTAGTHQVDVFFADRYQSQSAIRLDADVTLSPAAAVPEPSSMLLLGSVVPAVLAMRRRKTAKA